MSTSGTVDYSENRNSIVYSALRKCGVGAEGETATAQQVADASGDLNRMVKGLQAKGVKLWKSKELVLFIDTESRQYSIGPNGAYCCLKDDLVTAALDADAASGESTVTLDSVSGVSSGYIIGIVQDDDTIHWTTVNGAPVGSVVTLADVTTADASEGNAVYVFEELAQRPLRITHARRRDDVDNELPIDVKGEEDYYNIPNKGSSGPPLRVHYKPTLGRGTLYVWPVADTVDTYLILVGFMPIEDFDSANNEPDFPQEQFQMLVWNLAEQIMLEYGVDAETRAEIKEQAKYWRDLNDGFDVEEADIIITGDFE